jgi:hypothetical protein
VSPARAVPVEGRIDRDQLSALLRLLLGEGLRAGVDRSSGVRGHPLRQLAFSMLLMGAFFSPNVLQSPDWARALVVLYLGTTMLVLMAVVPETQEVRERHVEIMGSKPIARRTAFAARAILLAVLAALLSSSFGAFPLLAAALHFGASAPRVAAAALGLVSNAFTAAVAAFVLVSVSLRFWPPERVRRFSQTGLTLFLLAVTFSSLLSAPRLLSGGERVDRFAALGGALEWLPSTWMARLVAGGGPAPLLSSLGAVLVVAAAVVLGLGHGLERLLPSFIETVPPAPTQVSLPLTARLLRRLARLPLLRTFWLTPASAAVAEVMIRSARAEDLTRVRNVTNLALALGAFALVAAGLPEIIAGTMLLYLLVAGSVEATRLVRQSTSPEAAWIFRTAPLRGRDLLRAIGAAVLLGTAALPAALLGVLALREYELSFALLLVFGYALTAAGAVAATVAVDPGVPLSREPTVSSFWGILAGLFAGGLVMGAAQVVTVIARHLGPYGVWVLAVVDVMLLVAVGLLAWIAAARLDDTIADR